MEVLVLGAGLVGTPIAIDLAKDKKFNVSVADVSNKALERMRRVLENTPGNISIGEVQQDLSDPESVKRLAHNYDLVVNAVPGFMGYKTLKSIIEANRHAIDIAFFPEDPFTLDQLAKEKGVIVIPDCGVAPGMSNMLVGSVDHALDRTESVAIYVGGLPEVRVPPLEYKAVFSPIDVIEEYIRPAILVEHGKRVTKPALSDLELINFPSVGTLEAFNSDGLRTLANTIQAPFMKEKTLRYPGHAQAMETWREADLFSKEPIEINGVKIRPIDFTTKLLFPKWKLGEDEVDITIMKVVVEGEKKGKNLRYTYNLFDRHDEEAGTHSMARVTGYTATMALRMVANGLYTQSGISPPEYIGRYRECIEFIMTGLKERGVVYEENIEVLAEKDQF